VLEGLDVIALFARGSHVFEDRSEMFTGAVEATFATGFLSNVVVTGSYTTWRELDTLEPFLWTGWCGSTTSAASRSPSSPTSA
jgi:hypothetical protein